MVESSSPSQTRARGLVVAIDEVLPPKLHNVLSDRGLRVKAASSQALADLPSVLSDEPDLPDAASLPASFTVMLVPVAALPPSAQEAEALLTRVAAARVAVVLIGEPREDLVDGDESITHAWLPSPVQIGPLWTAVRSALTALSLKAELEAAKRLAKLKDTESRYLYEVGTALSAERDIDRLQDLILKRCRELTTADAGSVYLLDEDKDKQRILRFETSQNDSMEIPFQKFTMPLTDRSLAGFVALTGQTLNIDDVYHLPTDAPYGFNRSFDESTGYRTKSMLVVPMVNHDRDIIGVIQLINHKRSPATRLVSAEVAEREVIPFPPQATEVLDAFAGQAAVALNNQLLLKNIEGLFDGFVRASIKAIEQRDPTTSGHSERVAELTVGIAEAVNDIGVDKWKDVHFTEAQIREIRYAGLLHDFGKIGVKENVLVKAKKLYDEQLEVIKLRFGYVQKEAEVAHLRRKLERALRGDRDVAFLLASLGEFDAEFAKEALRIQDDLALVIAANEPAILAENAPGRLRELHETHTWTDLQGHEHPLIEETELLALSVKRGSLTDDERIEIESHVTHTFKFLQLMPWTKQFKELPTIAGAHHERLDGTGYPNRWTAEQIPIQSKMMAIADIYDALTASDRPYKKAVQVDKALDILNQEASNNHIDRELLDIFVQRRVFDIAVAVTMRQARQATDAALAGSRA